MTMPVPFGTIDSVSMPSHREQGLPEMGASPRRNPSRSGGRRAGFTILQVAIFLISLTILACLAVPGWFSRDDVMLDNAAVLLAEDLREVQNRAAFQRRPLRFIFLDDGSGYEVRDAADRLEPAVIGDRPFQRIYDRDAIFRGIRISNLVASDGRELLYGPRGIPLGAASIELSYDGDTRVLQVSSDNGLIEIVGLERRTWADDGL